MCPPVFHTEVDNGTSNILISVEPRLPSPNMCICFHSESDKEAFSVLASA
jgi:hypothetical protein